MITVNGKTESEIADLRAKRRSFWYRIEFPAAVLTAGIILVVGGFLDKRDTPKDEPYKVQISKLDELANDLEDMAGDLGGLKEFVVAQKDHILDKEAALSQLNEEHEKLGPILEADRKTVDAILSQHVRSIRGNVWTNRAIGFIIGYLASLAAAATRRSWRRRAARA